MIQKILHYLNPLTMFQKPKEGEEANINLKFMHGINRISIFMFLICLIIMLFKFLK